MRPAGVISYHSADSAPVLARGIRPKTQSVLGGTRLQRCFYTSWLHAGGAPLRINIQHLVHVLVKVDYHSGPYGVAGTGSARSPAGQWQFCFQGGFYSSDGFLLVAGQLDGCGNNPVDAGIGRVHAARKPTSVQLRAHLDWQMLCHCLRRPR